MTPHQALEVIDQMRLQVTATGAAHEQIREAVAVLRDLVTDVELPAELTSQTGRP